MGGWTTALQGIGRVGSDIASGSELLRKQRQEEAEDALRKLQLQMQVNEFQQRVKEYQDKQPTTVLSAIESAMGRKLNDEEKQRLLGFAPPISSLYSSTRPSAKGMEGLNRLTGMWEMIPGSEGYKAPTKPQTPGKVDPLVLAQIGPPPDPSKYAKGADDPAYAGAMKLWGEKGQQVKDRSAILVAQARGQAFTNRPGSFVDPVTGNIVSERWDTAIKLGHVPTQAAFNVMPKQAQFNEMMNASSKLRGILNTLQPGDAFDTASTIEMHRAMMADSDGALSASINNLMASGLNERQQDLVIWISQMNERILSLRNIAGMQGGAMDLRAALQATIPSIASGNVQMALKRLDAVDNQINLLYKGVANMPKAGANAPGSSNSTVDDIVKALSGGK